MVLCLNSLTLLAAENTRLTVRGDTTTITTVHRKVLQSCGFSRDEAVVDVNCYSLISVVNTVLKKHDNVKIS